MTINLKLPDATELKPRITVFGVGGAGGNAVNNMIESHLEGVEFVVANTDAQALAQSGADRRIQMGTALTEGLGAGSHPEIGGAAAEEALPEIIDHLSGAHMVFITAGMGGGTGTGAAPVIARAAREQGILTVGVVTKPFQFEGQNRMVTAERGISQLAGHVDTLIVIPNQNLFRIANEKTTFADAFAMADQVLYSGVAGITDLMVKEGLINLDFADVRSIMSEMGKAMMGTGEASGEKRAHEAAEAAIANPLLDDVSMKGARGLLISITGGNDLTLYEVDEAASRIREEVDKDANVILGATFDETLDGVIRVSVVATGISQEIVYGDLPHEDTVERVSPVSNRRAAYVISDRPSFNAAEAAPADEPVPAPAPAAVPFVARATEQVLPNPLPPRADIQVREYPEETVSESTAPDSTSPEPLEEDRIQAPETNVSAAPATTREALRPTAAAPQSEAKAPAAHTPARPPAQQAPQAATPPQPLRQHPVMIDDTVNPYAPRMPEIDEFPPIAVREMEARNGKVEEIGLRAHKKRAGFLERLANVGLGRKEATVETSKPREPSMSSQFGAEAANAPPAAERTHAPQVVSQRTMANDPDLDEDQLEIPAFLRRQAN